MKKLICLGVFLISIRSNSQNVSSVFTTDSIVFYGLDFSNCRLIGDFGNGDGFAMKTKMFPQWNNLLLKESPKYDIYGAFNKMNVYYDFEPVRQQNSKTDETKIFSFNDDHIISEDIIASMIKKYQEGDKKAGIGLVFIVEKFNKNHEQAVVHITFFDIATKKLLLTEVMKAPPSGAGLRNYWAKSIYLILKDIDMYAYSNWRKKYIGK